MGLDLYKADMQQEINIGAWYFKSTVKTISKPLAFVNYFALFTSCEALVA